MSSLPAVKSVVIVEDDQTAATALRCAIAMKDVQVNVVSTLAGALHYATKCPEMVLLDLALPDGSGLDFLKKLREYQCTSRVIVMTGMDGGNIELSRVWQYHIEAVLPKPLNLGLLFYLLGL